MNLGGQEAPPVLSRDDDKPWSHRLGLGLDIESEIDFLRHPLGCLRWQDCWPFASFKVGPHTFRMVCFICKGHSGVPMFSDLYSGCIHVCGWHLFSIAGQLLHFKAGILFDGQGLIVSMPWIINVGTLSLIHYC